jgi:hypothetical protein
MSEKINNSQTSNRCQCGERDCRRYAENGSNLSRECLERMDIESVEWRELRGRK